MNFVIVFIPLILSNLLNLHPITDYTRMITWWPSPATGLNDFLAVMLLFGH